MNYMKEMWAYIRRTDIPDFTRQRMTKKQMEELARRLLDGEPPKGILYTAFCFGLAKGYRLAKREAVR